MRRRAAPPTFALACAVSLALSWAACHRAPKLVAAPPDGEQWIAQSAFERGEARVATAKPQPISDPIVAGGRIAFDDQRVVHVLSPVTGRVTRVLAQLGQRVRKGTPLVAIASPDLGSAFSDEVKARADRVAAERDLKRQKALAAEKAGSTRDFETAEDNYRRARAEDERALQRLRLLRASAGTTGEGRPVATLNDAVTQEYLLPSQLDGAVIARSVNPGQEVQGQFSGGTPAELFTIGSIDSVWLLADVGESDLSALRVGARVQARVLAHPDRVFSGAVEWVSPTLNPALRTARIRCSLPNPEGLLKPEMYASVAIERPPETKLAIPRDAVVRINDQSFVYVAAGTLPAGPAGSQAGEKRIFQLRHIELPMRAGPPGSRPRAASEVFVPLDEAGRGGVFGGEPDLVPVLAGLSEGEEVLIDHAQPPHPPEDDPTLTRAQLASGQVQTAVAEEGLVPDPITLGGRLTFNENRVTHIFSPVNGRITRVLVAPGQHVRKGAPLARILSPDLGSAAADELKARADQLQAEHELKRQRELYAVHASAQRDLEAAEDNFARAQAEYARAAQKTRLLRQGSLDAVTQEYVLRSPIDGQVISRTASPGAEVQGAYAGGGNVVELFTVGSLEDLWLLGDVYEADLASVKFGAAVSLSVAAWPGRTFRGTVDWVSDTLDPVLRTEKVRCLLKNQSGLLRPEMYEVVHIAAPVRRALTVPRDALLRLGDETDVFVEGPEDKEGNTPFHKRRVLANEELPGDKVPVREGLKAGERVATLGSIFLVGN